MISRSGGSRGSASPLWSRKGPEGFVVGLQVFRDGARRFMLPVLEDRDHLKKGVRGFMMRVRFTFTLRGRPLTAQSPDVQVQMAAMQAESRIGALWQQRMDALREYDVVRDGNVFGAGLAGQLRPLFGI